MNTSNIQFSEECLAAFFPNLQSGMTPPASELAVVDSKTSQGAILGIAKVSDAAVQRAMNFQLDPNASIWTAGSVMAILNKIHENQLKHMPQGDQGTSNCPIQDHTGRSIQYQNLANMNPNAALFRHQELDNREGLRGPEQERDPSSPADILNSPLVQDKIIQCKALCDRVKYELETRGIDPKHFGKMVLGSRNGPVYRTLNSGNEWKDLKTNYAKRKYYNMLKWVRASESDKSAILNGEQPSDPKKYQLTSSIVKCKFTSEQRQELTELCKDGQQTPDSQQRKEFAEKWNIPMRTIRNFINRKRSAWNLMKKNE